jgi:hypothetical protein
MVNYTVCDLFFSDGKGKMLKLTPDQTAKIESLINTDDSLLPLFPVLERAVIIALRSYFGVTQK